MQKTLTYFITSIILIFSVSMLITSCKSDDTISSNGSTPVDTTAFTLSLDIGSSWDYQSIMTVSDIRPDSIRHYFTNNPVTGYGVLSSVKDTILNGVTARQLVNIYTQDSTTYQSKMYYVLADTALLQYAYWLHSSSDIFPDHGKGIHFIFNGKAYRSLHELFYSIENNIDVSSVDSLIFENPPPANLLYPIVTGKEWVYRNFGSSVLTKKYERYENLTIGSRIISCMKTESKWSTINDMTIYHYYSKFGKLKYDLSANDVLVSNEFAEVIGTIDMREIFNVTSIIVSGKQ